MVVLEALGVMASPAIAFFVLRLRAMAPPGLPDPAIHTMYLVNPRDVFARYAAVYQSTERLREAARVGFLVPGRLSYLLFGGVPGFFVLRYVFAILAVGPAYLLLRRLYGRAAGVVGIVVVMSCPIIVTAWGTDYPDSAVVSYMLGALACLAMPAEGWRRRTWLAAAGILMTMAVWAHSIAVPLVIATLVAYLAVRLLRRRERLVSDIAVLAGVAALVTGALSGLSGVLIGRFDFISPTWDAYRFLSSPAQVASWHAKGWKWVDFLPYLLVPPAVVAAGFVVFYRRLRSVPTACLMVGLTCAAQTAVFAYLQFLGDVETLEEHYFSSTLWASVVLFLAVTLCEAGRDYLASKGIFKWVPAAVVLVVPLVYELAPKEPAYRWLGPGIVLAAVAVAGSLAVRVGWRSSSRTRLLGWTAAGMVVMTAAVLYLSADPVLRDPYLNWVKDPQPAYSEALGGNASELIDEYRIATELPTFVGSATYQNEEMLMWWPPKETGTLLQPASMYHFDFNTLPGTPPDLTAQDRAVLAARRPPELLLLDTTGTGPQKEMRALSDYDPRMLRSTVLRSGDVTVYAWLVDLRAFGAAR